MEGGLLGRCQVRLVLVAQEDLFLGVSLEAVLVHRLVLCEWLLERFVRAVVLSGPINGLEHRVPWNTAFA